MTSKQKQKKLDNLAKARAAKAAKSPPSYKMYADSVVALDEDHELSMKNVRAWIKTAKEHKAAAHLAYKMNENGALARREMWTGYINSLESYLRTGNYCSMFGGGNMEKRIQRECVAMAYYPNGKPKREIGVYYKDYMCTWTAELENDERESYGMERINYNEKGHIIVEALARPEPKGKKKRKRKPMTEEQKAALVERLRKAREAKAAKKNNK